MNSDPNNKIAKIIVNRTGGRERDVVNDVERLQQYGLHREPILKALAQKYDEGGSQTLLEVPGVGVVRAALLIANDIETPRVLSSATVGEVAAIELGSEGYAKAIIETSSMILDESPTLDQIRSETDVTDETIISTLRPIATAGKPPSEVTTELVKILKQDPSVMETCSLDARVVYNLREAGYETVSDVASASIDELSEVNYLGVSNAKRAQEAARAAVDTTGDGASKTSTEEGEGQSKTNKASANDDDTRFDDTDVKRDAEGDRNGFNLKLLLIGSARPNLEDGEVAGIRIRAAIESADYDLDTFDAALYTGYVPPSPHHEQFTPEACFEELHEQLHAIAAQIPVYYITGDIGHGDPLENVYDHGTYAPSESHDPFATAQSELLTYVPIQDTLEIENVQLTQNPVIAESRDRCLLITPDLYPELWNAHDSLAYIAGGQLPGRLIEDSIAPSYAMENVGPKRPDSAGAVHTVTITEEGIESHDLIPMGDVEMASCPDHIDRGLQFSHEDSGCLFCVNENRYFEEWVQAGAHSIREDGSDPTLEEAVEKIADGAHFTEGQSERFRDYAANRIYEDYFGRKEAGPTVGGRRPLDSPLLDDPRDVYDAASLIASSQLRLEPHDRSTYFQRFDVTEVNETLSADFDDTRPPTSGEASTGVKEMDQAAFERRQLRGEWLFFPKRRTIGNTWTQMLELVDEGEVYDAQVGTAWHQQARSSRSDRYFLAAAVPNYFDVDDVHRVGELVHSRGIVDPGGVFSFKPVLYSQLGIHKYTARNYGMESSTRFTLRELRQLRDRQDS